MVDSDDGMNNEELEESDNESDEFDEPQDEGDAEYIIGIEQEPLNRLKAGDDDYPFEVLTAGEVVGLIQEIIRDVNTVVQVTYNLAKFCHTYLLYIHHCDCSVIPATSTCYICMTNSQLIFQ